ncbi:MAG: AAA family ATPase [Planctomycetota bacterium]
MRFQDITMRPYGTFQDRTIHFGERARLHLIYGPNGAGKSTTLEALRSALFGLKPGGRVHASRDLRIGATLLSEKGDSVSFMRRAAKTPRLWTADDSDELPPETLDPLLGNLTRERFETLFGLDHAKMVEGGEQLLKGKGEMGEALFGAMFGGQQLARIERRLRDTSKALFVERSPNSRIHALRKERDVLVREIREVSIRPDAYVKDRRSLAKVRSRQAELRRERKALRSEMDRIRGKRRSLQSIEQLEAKERERAAMAIARPLDPATAKRAVALFADSDALTGRGDERSKEMESLESQLADLASSVLDGVMKSAQEIEALIERRGSFRHAAQQIPRLHKELEASRSERPSSESEGSASLEALSIPEGESLASISAYADRLVEQLSQAMSRASLAAESHGKARALASEAARCLKALDGTVEEKLADALLDLAPFQGSPRDLRALTLPPPAAIEARITEEQNEAARARDLKQERERVESERQEAREALDRLASQNGGAPPTSEALQKARRERDELVRKVLAEEVSRASSALDLERAISRADRLGDERAGASASAAERDALEASLRRAAHREAALLAAAAELDAAAAASLARWQERLPEAALPFMTAGELDAWLPKRSAVLKEETAIRRDASDQHERCAHDLALAAAAQESRAAELSQVEERWREWLEARGLPKDLGPEAVRRRLHDAAGDAALGREQARLERDLGLLTEEVSAFDADVHGVCLRLGVQATDAEIESELEKAKADGRAEGTAMPCARTLRLEALLREARRVSVRSKEIGGRLEAERRQAGLANARQAELSRSLKDLAEENECDAVGQLRSLALGSERAAMLEADIANLRAALDQEQHPELPDEAEALEEALELAQARLDQLDQELSDGDREEGELRVRVEAEGSPDAARLQARVAEIDSELVSCAEEFVQVQLASRVLTQEVERHREATRGPLLRRAEALFKVLTLGAYEQLQSAEIKDREVMVAVRPNGRRVQAEEMSEGTCDQLYLALRIASVEQMLKTVVMPFIADDLFVNFDDERTEAALRVLASLAESTQVIVFSHHKSVVATAESLGAEGAAIEVHHLQDERSREASQTR